MTDLADCYQCGVQPELVNGEFGLFYMCPVCRLRGSPCADAEWAVELWGNVTVHQMPAGFELRYTR